MCWWFYNSDVHLYQQLCSIHYDLPGYVYSACTDSGSIDLPREYNHGSLSNTSANKYCFCCVVGYCIGEWMWYDDQ